MTDKGIPKTGKNNKNCTKLIEPELDKNSVSDGNGTAP